MHSIVPQYKDKSNFLKKFDSVLKNSTSNYNRIALKYFQGHFLKTKKNCQSMAESWEDCNNQQLNHFINEGKWDCYGH